MNALLDSTAPMDAEIADLEMMYAAAGPMFDAIDVDGVLSGDKTVYNSWVACYFSLANTESCCAW